MDQEPSEITPLPSEDPFKWTMDDYINRKCLLSEVGNIKPDDGYVKRVARAHAGHAIRALVEATEQTKDANARIKAANSLLDRGFGRVDAQPHRSIQQDYPELSWVSARRLLYKEIAKHAEDAVEVPSTPPLADPTSSDEPST